MVFYLSKPKNMQPLSNFSSKHSSKLENAQDREKQQMILNDLSARPDAPKAV